MIGMFLVGFSGSETKYTKEIAEFTEINTLQKLQVPAYTELASFGTSGKRTKVYYNGLYGYVTKDKLVNYEQLQKLDPEWKGNTILDNNTDTSNIIIIGDSKTAQMKAVVDSSKASWIAEEGAGYQWFAEIAVPFTDQYDLSGKKIYIMTGVNDLILDGEESYQKYVYFMYTKAQEWVGMGAEVVFVSVTPIQYSSKISNEMIDEYNNNIKDMLPSNIEYLDLYTALGNWGQYRTVDGLHYDAMTYQVVYSGLL